MDKELVARILQHYGCEVSKVQQPQKGYRNRSYAAELASGQIANLIVYKREAGILKRIQGANRIGNHLASQGFPARSTFDDRILAVRGRTTLRYAALYHYLPGATIPWEAYTMKHLKLLGKTLSDVHYALKSLKQEKLYSVADEYLALARRMAAYFADPGVQKALRQKLGLLPPAGIERFVELLEACQKLPDQQALHMDFVRSNILFSGSGELKITGILDFEKATWGHPAFDVARTLAFLIVDCKYKAENKVRKYFLASGYNKRGANSFSNWQLMEQLVDLFLLHDFYKFLRHNPYESLKANEHFIRATELLQQRERDFRLDRYWVQLAANDYQ